MIAHRGDGQERAPRFASPSAEDASPARPQRNRPEGPSLQGAPARTQSAAYHSAAREPGNRSGCSSTACRCCCSRPPTRRWRGAFCPCSGATGARAHPLDWAIVAGLPRGRDRRGDLRRARPPRRRPLGGHIWLSLAARARRALPGRCSCSRAGATARSSSAASAARARPRSASRSVTASSRRSPRSRARSARAHDPVEVARPLVRQVDVAVRRRVRRRRDRRRRTATRRPASTPSSTASPPTGGRSSSVDLRNEPSGIASAVFDAAPVTRVRRRELAARQPAPRRSGSVPQSGVLDPDDRRGARARRARGRVDRREARVPPEELALLQAIAAEAALALERLRSAAALADALEREQRDRRDRAARSAPSSTRRGSSRVARDELRARSLHADESASRSPATAA